MVTLKEEKCFNQKVESDLTDVIKSNMHLGVIEQWDRTYDNMYVVV